MSLGIYSVSIGLLFVVSQVLGCSKFEPGARAKETGHEFDTDDRKVFYSKVVVYGEVGERVKGNYPYKGVKGVYTVKFNVKCTYLGGPDIPSSIYIAGLGNERGQIPGCPAAPIGKSREAVMFLKPTARSDVFETEFRPNVGATDLILDDLSLTCGLNLTENSDSICEDFLPLTKEDGCISWTPIVIKPEPKVTIKPKPEVTPKPEPEETPKPEPKEEPIEPEPTEGNENDQIRGCPAAPGKKGRHSVMFLKNTSQSDLFEVEYSPNYGLDDVMLDDLSMVCGLNLEDNHDEVCSDYIPATEEEGCVKWKPIKVKVEDKTEKPEPEEEPVPESEEETSEPEPEEETTSKNDADDTVVDINGKDKGKNNQSDEGYETKPETDKKTGPAAGSSGDENGSTVVTASMLVTLITIFLTIVV